MSKRLLLAALLAVCAAWHLGAQPPNTDKGALFFKGGSNLQFSLEDGKPFSAQVGLGYFLLDNLVAGCDLGYERAGQFEDFWARPFARYYIAQRFFLGAGLNGIKSEEEDAKDKLVPDVEAGFALNIDPSFAFEPTVRHLIQDGSKPIFSLNITVFFLKF